MGSLSKMPAGFPYFLLTFHNGGDAKLGEQVLIRELSKMTGARRGGGSDSRGCENSAVKPGSSGLTGEPVTSYSFTSFGLNPIINGTLLWMGSGRITYGHNDNDELGT